MTIEIKKEMIKVLKEKDTTIGSEMIAKIEKMIEKNQALEKISEQKIDVKPLTPSEKFQNTLQLIIDNNSDHEQVRHFLSKIIKCTNSILKMSVPFMNI